MSKLLIPSLPKAVQVALVKKEDMKLLKWQKLLEDLDCTVEFDWDSCAFEENGALMRAIFSVVPDCVKNSEAYGHAFFCINNKANAEILNAPPSLGLEKEIKGDWKDVYEFIAELQKLKAQFIPPVE